MRSGFGLLLLALVFSGCHGNGGGAADLSESGGDLSSSGGDLSTTASDLLSGADLTTASDLSALDLTGQVDEGAGDAGADASIVPPALVLRAGALGGHGNADGTGAAARFYEPAGVAVDAAGNAFVADSANWVIRKITLAGVVTTLAGSTTTPGSTDGTGSAARFASPAGIAVDGAGNLFVADTTNHTIRKVTAAGVVTTFAGAAGMSGSTDGTGAAARFSSPTGIAIDGAGTLFVTDLNDTIRKITSASVVTTIAGTAGASGSANGTGAAARFDGPSGIAVDAAGNLFVTDKSNYTIRKITAAAVVTTLAGTAGLSGSTDGTGAAASFGSPSGIAVDAAGQLFVADSGNRTIREITAAGVVTTFAGFAGRSGSTDDTGGYASFYAPSGVAVGSGGTLFVTDSGDSFGGNHTLRKISPAAAVTTLAGAVTAAGSTDGAGIVARFSIPAAVTVNSTDEVFVADYMNGMIRTVSSSGVVAPLAGAPDTFGNTDATGAAATFGDLSGIAVNGAGSVFVTDSYNDNVREITPGGVVTTFAGPSGASAGTPGSADGTSAAARFSAPAAIAADGSGNLYVADKGNQTIRKITAAGVVTTLAGLAGSAGSSDGTGATARFSSPAGIAVDSAGNVFVADQGNDTIRRITAAGVVTTLAGTAGMRGSADGTGAAARFSSPSALAVDGSGDVFVVDSGNSTVRKITPAGAVTTVAGILRQEGVQLGPLPASLNFANGGGIAVAPSGNLVVTGENSVLDVLFH